MAGIFYKMNSRQWIILSIMNFLFVGLLGLLMRLKFLFPISWIDQKNIMHAHSHFAFSGWVTQALMVFLIMVVSKVRVSEAIPSKYQPILIFNALSSYGMLIAFSLTGYAFASISFSFLVVLASYWFVWILWTDLRNSSLPRSTITLIQAALIYHVLSSFGTYSLVLLKVTHHLDPLKQLASIYFYLHFQYNGWFFFGCLSLLTYWIYDKTGKSIMNNLFARIYAWSVIPAYFLSVLWWKAFPNWLYLLLLLTVILQLVLWTMILLRVLHLRKQHTELHLAKEVQWIWTCVVLAVCVKLILQAVSIIPELSQLAYGFRPIVIAYLHLVLLVIISLFLIGYGLQSQSLLPNKGMRYGIFGLLIGIFLNEFILMMQGLGGLLRHSFQGTHETLAIASLIIVCSILHLLISQTRKQSPSKSENKTSF